MRIHSFTPAGVALGALVAIGTAAQADFTANASLSARSLKVENLVGEITVEGTDGATFEIDASIQGRDATRETMRLETVEGDAAIARVLFPKGEDEFVYPRLGRSSRTTFSFTDQDREDGWLSALLGGLARDQISVRGSGRGIEAWADLTIRVPRGKEVRVKLGVGEISAANVDGNISLLTHSGKIDGNDLKGDVKLDTGSGAVVVNDVAGNLSVDTGSGSVRVNGVKGQRVSIDTGSGSVTAADIDCESFSIDTGSGSIEGIGCAADDAKFDTGSGSIEVSFERVGAGNFVFDTGSGGIDVLLPEQISADIEAETGAGNIQVDVHKPQDVEKHDSSVRFTLGAGQAQMKIDSGSGTIRIAQPS